MSLQQAVDYFTSQTHILSSMSIVCGTQDSFYTVMGGDADSDGLPVTKDTIYDLASLTKLFTGLLSYRLMEQGNLDFSAPVTRYAPQFINLASISVSQILGFEIGLVTPQRVDVQPDFEMAMQMLQQIAPHNIGDARAYSDMHAMVMKHILQGSSGTPYMDLARKYILQPLDMKQTWCTVPEAYRSRCCSYDKEHRIERGKYITRDGIGKGTPHDPKARILMKEDDCPGHAGLFSTIGDIRKLSIGILKEDIVSKTSLYDMTRNRTGRKTTDGGWTQFLGALCYVKHPQLYHSQVPQYMGDHAIALSGFTGNHISLDPDIGIFVCYLGNRVLDRLSVLLPRDGEKLTDYGLNEDGSGSIIWPDGTRVWSSVNYVHQKDQHFHVQVKQELGL